MTRVTAALIHKDGKILLAQRRKGLNQGLKWELPGGKIEEGETPEACLVRELLEELSVRARVGDFFASSFHDYSDGGVEILAYNVELIDEDFELNSHERIAWAPFDHLEEYDLAEADKPIIKNILTDNPFLRE